MKKNKKLLDYIGAGCGIFLVLVLLISIISNAVASAPPKGAVTLSGSAPGRNADVQVEVVTDGTTIAGVSVLSHEETEGIGTMAVDQLPAAIVEANSLAVDNVSGASITSEAIKAAVANALTEGGFDPSAFGYVAAAPAEEPAPAEEAVPAAAVAADGAYIPGTYTGEGQGLFSTVTVTLTVDESGITDVVLDTSGETPEIGGAHDEEFIEQVRTQGAAIDGVSGASVTSQAIRDAVAQALSQALPEGAAAEEPAAEEAAPAEALEPSAEAVTETGSYNGIDGPVVTQVTADAERIYDVQVLEQNETQGIGSVAVEKLPGAIVAANSLLVDDISGATVTSTAIKNGIRDALTKAGIDPAVFEVEPEAAAPVEKTEETLDVDVVVVGAGGAGMSAAITASDAGMKVIVVESQGIVGGNSVRSTGGMNAAPTEWREMNEFGESAGVESTLAKVEKYPDNARIQELGKIVSEQWAEYQANPEGYFDSVELFQLDTLIGGGGINNPDLVQTLAERSADAIEWLGGLDPEVILHNVAQFGGASVKRIHRPVDENGKTLSVGAYVVPLLQENLENRGVTVLLSTTANEILMSGERACGIKAEDDEHIYTINAKAVVLATGGFGANNDMIASIRPELDGFITTNAPGIQGQGIQMAQAIGADTVDLEQIQLHPTVHVQDSSAVLITEGLRGDGAILVNQEGERFYDEVSTRDKVSAAEFEQTGGYAWLIVDSRMSDASNVIQGYISKGYAESGESYEALAEAIGAPADVFAATMASWNACVEAKEDAAFGRVSFANPLDQAPYYAIKVQPGIHHTMGGIKIDTQAQVINTEGDVIAGLFAAGEVTGGVHGNNRLGGNAVADFVIFGRIAGSSAADYAAAIAPAEYSSQAETFTGTAAGRNGDLTVEVTADANHIYAIEVTDHQETEGIGTVAIEKLPAAIIAAQSLDVDDISSATVTSGAIKEAVAAALASGGIDPANLVAGEAPETGDAAAEPLGDRVYEADVVVIGAGGAGMSAAITASDAGMKVIVVESQAIVGGNSVRSTGGMNAAPTEWREMNEFGESAGVESTLAKVEKYPDNARIQELGKIVSEQWAAYQANPEGYFDSVELFQLDTLIGGGGINNPDLVQTLAERSADAIEWLGSLDPEVILHNVAQFGGASVKRIHRPVDENGKTLSVGAYVVPLLQKNLENRGVTVLLNTTANEIVRDSLGIVRGIVCTDENGYSVSVNARSVVIASGGFGANNDMIASIRPELDGFITTNAPGIQGQGIQMAQAIGADTVDLEQIQLHPTVHVQGSDAVLITEGLRGDGAILVNQEGERFYDEVSTRDKVSAAEFEQTGGYAWLIVDSRMSDASNVIQGYINKGYAESGDSYEALAEAIGAPADAFAATMESWNACVEAKEDAAFGRVSFANPLDQAPYYAIKVQPGIHHTMGGIRIDSDARVLDADGAVIPGLFAAGEVTGGVHGNNRLGGNAVADFVIFGRIAGASAAAYADR